MNATPFQYVIMGIFVALLLGGVTIFALFGGKGQNNALGDVMVWGTADRAAVERTFNALSGVNQVFQHVRYTQKAPETYEADLVNAFASNTGPDVFFIDDTQIVSFKNKITFISYKTMSQRTFNDTYVNESALFLSPEGIIGLPLLVNPLVMYWNKDLFAGANIATYPRAWSELPAVAQKMTALDTASNVKRSAVALGTYDNVRSAKEIFSALLLQLGNSIVGRDVNGRFVSTLALLPPNTVEGQAQTVLRFYTGFSNPSQSNYSWNRSLPNSFNAFSAGDLGIYFGLASDYSLIKARNPNLSFDVAVLPQTSSAKTPATYGRMIALAIPRSAKNPAGALVVVQEMTSAQGSQLFSANLGLPSARRDLLTLEPANPVQSVFAQSALIARGWYDPGASVSGPIVKDMIDSIISGRLQLGDAVQRASGQLDDAFDTVNKQ